MPDNKTPLPSDPDEPIFGSQPTNPFLLGDPRAPSKAGGAS